MLHHQDFHSTVLGNGTRLVSVLMPHSYTVSVAIYVKAGSRYEESGEDGVYHFIEHMLFKGTKKRPSPQLISGEIENIGGYLNASTDHELTVYWCQVPANYWIQALDVLCDMIKNPIFELAELERERNVIIEEISAVNDHPEEIASLLVDEGLWPEQPIGRDVGGSEFTVKNLSRDGLINSYKRQYTPSNIVISVAGNLLPENVFDVCNKYIGDWPIGIPGNWIPAEEFQNKPAVLKRNFPSEQMHISLGFRGVSAEDPSRFAINLLSVIMAGGMSSRLFLELREKRGLVYEISSSVLYLIDTGALYLSMNLDRINVLETIQIIVDEMNNLKTHLTYQELERAKKYLQGHFMMTMESTLSVANWYGAQFVIHGEVKSFDDIYQNFENVSSSHILKAASSALVAKKTNLAVVGSKIDTYYMLQLEKILLNL
jgi:predicted Zn-dependent peptidase